MSDSFKKLKKKFLAYAIAESALYGLFSGLFVSGLILLILKLTGVKIHFLYYVLIGVCIAAAAGGLLFYFLRPTDKFIARKLDDDNSLNEKVQTMLYLSGETGDIVSLQREDAENRLKEVKFKAPSLKRILIFAASAVCSLAVFFTAVFVKDNYKNKDKYNLTDIQAVQLSQLIEDVKRSALVKDDKDGAVVILDELYARLPQIAQASEMRRTVNATVVLIDGLLSESNSYLKLGNALATSSDANVKTVSGALISGARFYKRSAPLIKKLETVENLAEEADETVYGILNEKAEGIAQSYSEMSGSDLSSALSEFAEGFTTLASSSVQETDSLYLLLSAYSAEMKTISDRITGGGYGQALIQAQIATACENFSQSGAEILADQAYKLMMDEFIRNRLSEIFSVPIQNLPDGNNNNNNNSSSGDDNNGGDNNENNNGGGGGGGGSSHGSEDYVYSPEKDEKVKYWEVLSDYYGSVSELLGDAPEELKEYINKYFEILNGKIPQDGAGN